MFPKCIYFPCNERYSRYLFPVFFEINMLACKDITMVAGAAAVISDLEGKSWGQRRSSALDFLSSLNSTPFTSLELLQTECLHPSKSIHWNPNPQRNNIRIWDFWEMLGRKDESLMNEIKAFIKETPESHREKAVYEPGCGQGREICQRLDLGLPS